MTAPSQQIVYFPFPLANFKSTLSPHSPFAHLLAFVSCEVGFKVDPAQVQVSRETFAATRELVRRWCASAGRTPDVALLSEPGVTAPLFSSSASRGMALVTVSP